ncbi:MAG TPA: transposase, partial [Chloroflexota bacterium]|nr:transposase [Chloroflexota bacterium]
ERAFCEELDFQLLWRWFLDMSLMEPSFDQSTFSKNRGRLLQHVVALQFFDAVVRQADALGLPTTWCAWHAWWANQAPPELHSSASDPRCATSGSITTTPAPHSVRSVTPNAIPTAVPSPCSSACWVRRH